MLDLIKIVRKKINGIVLNLSITGIIMLCLGVLIFATDFMVKMLIGILVLIVAYVFFYSAYKIWTIKKEIEKFFNL